MQTAVEIADSIRAIPLRPDSVVWIAYSGGLDSTVLLHACIEVLGNSICKAVHIDHGIQPESHEWAEYCREVCDEWGVSLEIERVDLASGNLELQARMARYEQFERRLNHNDLVLTAHHADDVAETQLWQFLTGRAIVGIASKKVLGKGHVVRPFLHVAKQQLKHHAENHSLTWIEDPSNADTALDRNWIRHRILPALEQRFPGIRERLSALAPSHLPQVRRGPFDLSRLDLDVRHVRGWLLAHGVNPPGSTVEEIIRQAHARADASPEIEVSDARTVRRFRENLYLVTHYSDFAPQVTTPGYDLELSNGYLTWEMCENGLQRGESYELSNRAHLAKSKLAIRVNQLSKSLSSLFQEYGVAPWLRDGWPVLMKNEEVVCVPGLAIADEFKHSSTKGQSYAPTWNPKTE